jgi:hypothetical protein
MFCMFHACFVHAFGGLCSGVCMRLSTCPVPVMCMLGSCACLASACLRLVLCMRFDSVMM